MIASYLYPDSITYVVVKLLVLGFVVWLWFMSQSAPVT